jgi:hypothetical protein
VYLQELADAIRRRVDPELVPAHSEALFRIYAVLALAKGSGVTDSDVHNAWVAWAAEIHSRHEDLRPFSELDPQTVLMDRPYRDAIRATALGEEDTSDD